MQRRKVDNRIRVLIENGVAERQRSLFVVVGDRGKDQVRPCRSRRSSSGPAPLCSSGNETLPAPGRAAGPEGRELGGTGLEMVCETPLRHLLAGKLLNDK